MGSGTLVGKQSFFANDLIQFLFTFYTVYHLIWNQGCIPDITIEYEYLDIFHKSHFKCIDSVKA